MNLIGSKYVIFRNLWRRFGNWEHWKSGAS